MNSNTVLHYFFETDVWVWPIIAISSLGAFWIYHRRVISKFYAQQRVLMENEYWLNEAQQIGNIGSWYRYIADESSRWSPQLYRIYGLLRSTSPSMESFLKVVHPDDRQQVKERLAHISATGETTVSNHRIVRKDGTVVFVRNTVKGAFNDENKLVAVYGSVLDVTEHRLYEEKLTKARDEAESANRAKGAFLSSVSHEIRTPLNAIIGFSNIMLDKELSVAQYKSYGESINISGKSLSSLIKDVLDLSALESLSFTLDAVVSNIGRLLDEVVEVFKLIVAGKGISLVLDRPSQMPPVRIDEKRLRQILINIIGNAVKFTDVGQVKVGVELSYCLANKHECDLTFTIKDTGIGINPIDQTRIFREFEQESASINRRFGGSGLGLSIVMQLLELMGGTLQLQSELGQGSSFKVCFYNLPVVDEMENSLNSVKGGVMETMDREENLLLPAEASVGRAALHLYSKDMFELSEGSVEQIKEAFGERFAKISKGVNMEFTGETSRALCRWAEESRDNELINFAECFAEMTSAMNVVGLIKTTTKLSRKG